MPDLPWLVYAFPFLFLGIIAFAAFYKWLEVRQAAGWPQTTGRVVASTSERRKVRIGVGDGGKLELRNFAKIVYEYEVSGQKLRNSRVSIGENLGNFEVEETIRRYPVGTVVTVYYNPRRPRDAVLEREPPKGLFGCVIWFLVIATVGILVTFFGFNQLAGYVRQVIVNPDYAPVVIGLATIGTLALVFALAIRRRGNQAKGWPKVTGRIETSEIDQFESYDASKNRSTTQYRALITYAYAWNGVDYSGTKISLGAEVSSNRQAYAKRLTEKYPPGSLVEVYVDPKNPSEAVLEFRPRHLWILWTIGAVLLAGAAWIARLP